VADLKSKHGLGRVVLAATRRNAILRWLAHVVTSGTMIVAVRERA
jgi:hypothetical protein